VVEGVAGLLGRAIEKELTDMAIRMDKTYFEELFHGSPAAIVILSQEGIVERVNREFTNLFQYEPEEIIGHRIDDFLPSGPDRENANLLTDRVRDGERVAHEGVRYRKDGKPVYVSIIGVQSVPMAEGPVILVFIMISPNGSLHRKSSGKPGPFQTLVRIGQRRHHPVEGRDRRRMQCPSLGIFRCKREELVGHSAIELSPARQPNGVPSLNLAVKYDRAAQDKEPTLSNGCTNGPTAALSWRKSASAVSNGSRKPIRRL
jgi:PAS domain S-box-containing protein